MKYIAVTCLIVSRPRRPSFWIRRVLAWKGKSESESIDILSTLHPIWVPKSNTNPVRAWAALPEIQFKKL